MAELVTKDRLTFDEATHTYFWDGKKVPSVNQIIDKVFHRSYGGDPWYGERGRLFHTAAEYFDQGTLDESSVDPEISPFLDSYKDFLRETKATSVLIEQRLYSQMHGFAGTIDRVWEIDGRRVLGDFKTGNYMKYHKYQLWAYDILYSENYKDQPLSGRRGLYLKTKPYDFRDFGQDSAFKFLSILDVYHL